MEESASKVMFDSDAHIRETRKCSEISVEGYDTWLQNYATELTLRKHFSSCGEVLGVSVFKRGFALMRIEGEDAKDKALELSGTDVGGWTAIVKAAPWQREPFDYSAPRMKDCSMFVSGYDTRLPEIDIQIALCKHFSSCGEVISVTALSSGRALITIKGERCVEKALKLSGPDVGEMNLVVIPPMQYPAMPGNRKKISRRTPIGNMLPCYKHELEKEKNKKKKKKKMEMEKEMEKMKMEIVK